MRRRVLLLTAAAGLAVGVGALAVSKRPTPPAPAAPAAAIGGPFSLVDTQGRTVTQAALLGKPTAIFFGFTFCPEVCPTTLLEMTAALKTLGADADRLNVVFVSVDPERDTPQQLRLYLSNFDPRIRGLTGTPEAVAQAAKAYRVYYAKVPQEGGYTVDHSSAVYLFDSKGRFVEPVAYGAGRDRMVAQLRRLIAAG